MSKENLNNLGLYIHIPFCERKCRYCDFLSFTKCTQDETEEYVKALLNEIKCKGNEYNNSLIDSIFIGGGTPSLIQKEFIGDVLNTIYNEFKVSENAEISIEANPGTLSMDKLLKYKQYGINRLSLGVQSFDDDDLRFLGRIHSGNDAMTAFYMAREAGFDNINIDLMFAFPKHNEKKWSYNLEKIGDLSPEHISFYSLQIEEGTPMYYDLRNGIVTQLSEECDRKLYHIGVNKLKELGYIHYEISNGAKPGFQCRHNLKYWDFQEYLGLGLGAHSFSKGTRFANTENIREYIESSGNSLSYKHNNSQRDSVFEYVFTALRKTDGIDFSDFKETFEHDFWYYYDDIKDKILQYEKKGKIVLTKAGISLTIEGMDISNAIMSEFAL